MTAEHEKDVEPSWASILQDYAEDEQKIELIELIFHFIDMCNEVGRDSESVRDDVWLALTDSTHGAVACDRAWMALGSLREMASEVREEIRERGKEEPELGLLPEWEALILTEAEQRASILLAGDAEGQG